MTDAFVFVTVTGMKNLEFISSAFFDFLKVIHFYSQKRARQFAVWFERYKDIIVGLLIIRRGTYQRPFLHTSLLMIVSVGVVGGPIIANTYPSVASDEFNEFTPPSAVLSSFDDQTLTQVSEKPRDSIYVYPVAEGDTLGSIADKFDVSVDTIKWANPDIKGEHLDIGQELRIPPVTGIIVKIKKGDTVYSLAKQYQTDAQKIVNWPFNDFTDLDTFALAAGQTLVIPDGVMPEAKPIYSPQTIAQVGIATGNGQFLWPTQGVISQRPVSYHMAVDIANSNLPPVIAADSGKVVLVEYGKYGYGRHVIIDHGNGYQTLYAHMSEIYVQNGQSVTKGAVIGKVGTSGRSTGPHLHFEIRKGGVLLNPLSFLSK